MLNLDNLSRSDIEVELSTLVYQSCIRLFEHLECAHKTFGNGHHASQDVAAYAAELLKKKWKDD